MSDCKPAYPRPFYRPVRCPCGHGSCTDWHVDGVAAVQGVRFSEEQAIATAALLNAMGRESRLADSMMKLHAEIGTVAADVVAIRKTGSF